MTIYEISLQKKNKKRSLKEKMPRMTESDDEYGVLEDISDQPNKKQKKSKLKAAKELSESDENDEEEEEEVEEEDDEEEEEDDYDDDEEEDLEQEKNNKRTKSELEEKVLQMSESEDDDEQAQEDEKKISITKSLLTSWEQKLSADSANQNLIKQLTSAFRAVVEKAGGNVPPSIYQLTDSSAFNTVLRLCFTYFPSAWRKLAKINDSNNKIGKAKWKLLKIIVKDYIFDVIKFLPEIQEQQVLAVILKHLAQIVEYYIPFRQKAKSLLKVLVTIWSTKGEQCKILSFVCISKLVKSQPNELLDFALKRMYLTFVKNTTMITPSSWPGIQFMHKSYAEMCSMDLKLTYQQGFLYIRQLAIYLRNAITSKKKETVGAVHNWQYMQCIYLWTTVLNTLRNEESLQSLVYPLIQIIIGCCRLMPTAKYIPLRLHCVKCLMILTEQTNVYAPIPSLISEILECINFSKRPTRQSLKTLDFKCLLKLSKSQLEENNYKVSSIDQCCDLLLENLQRFQNKPTFTELTFGITVRLKRFCKKCPVADLSRNIRLIALKIQEHSKWMEEEKAKSYLNLNDDYSLEKFEKRLIKNKNGPFEKYYESFKKLKDREMRIKTIAMKSEPLNGQKTEKKIKKENGFVKASRKSSKVVEKMIKNEIVNDKLTFADDIVTDFNLNDL